MHQCLTLEIFTLTSFVRCKKLLIEKEINLFEISHKNILTKNIFGAPITTMFTLFCGPKTVSASNNTPALATPLLNS